MKFRHIPILLASSAMLIVSSWKLISDPSISPAASGVLLGAGLVLLSVWVIEELFKNHDDKE